MPVTVRFAPSPTGSIHLGNARTALFNWLLRLREGGRFILRFDDTDLARSTAAFAEAIAADLAWLGIVPDEVHRQSERHALYADAADRLRDAGRLYACYETPEELERRRAAQLRRGQPPVYDRAALHLTTAEKAAFEAAGRRPHWRFLLGTEPRQVGWTDLFRGDQEIDLGSLSDPVLVREDRTFLYTLPSVVDDIDMGVSHIVRGDDHLTNTAVQIVLFETLGAAPPVFGHHNLVVGPDGEPLSKRSGAGSIAALRDAGFEPPAVASAAVLVGTSEPFEPADGLAELAARFDPAKVSRSPARFDPADLDGLNARLLHRLGYAEVADRLTALGVGGGEPFWHAVRANCTKLGDALAWWRVVTGPVAAQAAEEDRAFLAEALAALPAEPWDEQTFSAWTAALKDRTERRGRSLFRPLRLALTGLDHGPELAALLPLIGRKDTMARLAAARQA